MRVLPDLFAFLASEDKVRSVILTGAGDHFSAGGDVEKDIDPLRTKTVNEFKAYFESLAELYEMIYNYSKPTIAAINGYALGAGMELTLMCDIRIASENLQMGEFFVRMGLVPENRYVHAPENRRTRHGKTYLYDRRTDRREGGVPHRTC